MTPPPPTPKDVPLEDRLRNLANTAVPGDPLHTFTPLPNPNYLPSRHKLVLNLWSRPAHQVLETRIQSYLMQLHSVIRIFKRYVHLIFIHTQMIMNFILSVPYYLVTHGCLHTITPWKILSLLSTHFYQVLCCSIMFHSFDVVITDTIFSIIMKYQTSMFVYIVYVCVDMFVCLYGYMFIYIYACIHVGLHVFTCLSICGHIDMLI